MASTTRKSSATSAKADSAIKQMLLDLVEKKLSAIQSNFGNTDSLTLLRLAEAAKIAQELD